MIITYHGAQMVRINSADTSIVFNPISKDSGLPVSRFGADVAIVSRLLPEFNGISEVSRKDKVPFVIDGPGEYEISKLFVQGVASPSKYKKEGINTIYLVKLEDINILFLGAVDDKKLDAAFLEDVDDIDIVFVPIGGDGVLEADEAHKLAVSLEPKIIIPVHYEYVGEKDALEKFLKESGAQAQAEEKISLKKKDLESKSAEPRILKLKK